MTDKDFLIINFPKVFTLSGEPRIPDTHDRCRALGIEETCDCWTGGRLEYVICSNCGAAYLPAKVVEHPIWHCPDCGEGYATRSHVRLNRGRYR